MVVNIKLGDVHMGHNFKILKKQFPLANFNRLELNFFIFLLFKNFRSLVTKCIIINNYLSDNRFNRIHYNEVNCADNVY